MKTIKELLIEHYLEWQNQSGEIKKQSDFANYIGEKEKYLSMVMNGRKASKRQVAHFADFFKDPRFYDAVGEERPEPLLSYTRRNWGNVPSEVKKRIAEEVAQYSTEPLPKEDDTETSK